MNKDVIYIEPEDDITDIISKIENSKSKIVALVPPKKAGVFRSVVNIKLIAKSAASAEKTVVLVTTDPPILKLAAATKIPVTKNLQSAPSIPKMTDDGESVTKEELREPTEESEEAEAEEKDKGEEEDEKTEEAAEKDADAEKDEAESDDEDEKEDEKEEESKKSDDDEKKSKKAPRKKSENKFKQWLGNHRKIVMICGGSLILILVLVWALVIAPSVTLTVGIKTEINNFSEPVSFSTKFEDENADEGKFYLEEKKVETVKKVEFEATGQKNVGTKAQGNVVVYAYFKRGGSIQVKSGSSFTYNSLVFVSDGDVTLSWDGETASNCENNGQTSAITSGCLISARVKVLASEPGENYNVSPSNSGWNTTTPVAVYSDAAISGGTNEMITVVSEEDIKKAKEKLSSSDQEENKEKLLAEIADNMMVIEASFSQVTDDAVSSPAVGEKVEDGVKPILTAKTTAKIYAIDKTKVEEFITEKAKLGDNQKIYEIKDPFIENFATTDGGYAGKLKTSYSTGPKITENDVIEIAKKKGFGEAQHDLRDISGIVSVTIDPSFPWVTSIPNDPNKITVNLEVKKEQ